MAAKLILDIAWTHVTARVRQTLVGMAGVAMGVGFTIMMAGLMQGSQIDFLRQLVDTMPHITIQDERRTAPPRIEDIGRTARAQVGDLLFGQRLDGSRLGWSHNWSRTSRNEA